MKQHRDIASAATAGGQMRRCELEIETQVRQLPLFGLLERLKDVDHRTADA